MAMRLKHLIPCCGLAALLVLAGCSSVEGLDTFDVQSATLYDFGFAQGAALGGLSRGHGRLALASASGELRDLEVEAWGASAGLQLSVAFERRGRAVLDTSATSSLTAQDLFGWYRGEAANAQLGLGGAAHRLENSAGVQLDAGALTAGLGAGVALEALYLSAVNDFTIEEAAR